MKQTSVSKSIKELEKKNRELEEVNEFLKRSTFFHCEPPEVGKAERLKFIALKTDDGSLKGKISFCCKALDVNRGAFYDYLNRKAYPWK